MMEADTVTKTDESSGDHASRIFFYCACFTIFAFVSRLGELIPFLGRIRLNLISLILCTVLFVVTGQIGRKEWLSQKEVKLMGCLIVLALVNIPLSVWPGASIRMLVNGQLTVNLAVFLFCFSVVDSRRDLITMLKIFCCSVVVMAMAMRFNPTEVEGGRLVVTQTYDSNDLALLFTCTFPLVVAFFLSSRIVGKLLTGAILALLLFSTIKTGSRGGLLAFGVAFTCIFFSKTMALGWVKRLMLLLFVAAFLLSSHADTLLDRWQQVLQGSDYNLYVGEEGAGGGRLALWKEGLRIFFPRHVIFGVGAGNSAVAMGEEFGSKRWKAVHNSFLQAALELGALGFVLFVVMLYRIHRNCRDVLPQLQERADARQLLLLIDGVWIALIAYMIAAMFLSQFYSVVVPFLLAISAGIRDAAETIVPEEGILENSGDDVSNIRAIGDWSRHP